jgi:hypothetical protein
MSTAVERASSPSVDRASIPSVDRPLSPALPLNPAVPLSPAVERPSSPVSPRSQELLEKLANQELYISQMRSYLKKISNKYSPLFDAIAMGDDCVVNACLAQKSEYDAINEEGYSPLTYAVHRR